MERAGVTITRRLRLQHIDIAESSAVLDEAVDTEDTLRFAVDDDVAPDDAGRLCVVGRGKRSLVNHACSFAVHLVVRQQVDISVAAEGIGVVVVAYRLQIAYLEGKVFLHVLCKFNACGWYLYRTGAEGKG